MDSSTLVNQLVVANMMLTSNKAKVEGIALMDFIANSPRAKKIISRPGPLPHHRFEFTVHSFRLDNAVFVGAVTANSVHCVVPFHECLNEDVDGKWVQFHFEGLNQAGPINNTWLGKPTPELFESVKGIHAWCEEDMQFEKQRVREREAREARS